MSRRVQYLDELGGRGMRTGFCGLEGVHHPLPTYPYHWAPNGLMTCRQLRQRAAARRPDAGKALEARKTCPSCQHVKDYCIPLCRGECNDCAGQAEGITRPGGRGEPWDMPNQRPEME